MTVWTWINKEGQKADKKVMRKLEFRSLGTFLNILAKMPQEVWES